MQLRLDGNSKGIQDAMKDGLVCGVYEKRISGFRWGVGP